MKNRYNYKAAKKGLLLKTAIKLLKEKVDPADENYQKYEDIIKQEVTSLENISFDGYMLLLQDVVVVSKEISGFVSSFGSIGNSLTAYVLGIVDFFDFEQYKFRDFTPFVKKPVVNILISSYANNGCVGYVSHKYPKLIKKVKKRSIVFKDDLKIKFIDLGIETRVKYDEDGFRI